MRIGTASARRRAQLLALEPTLSIEPLRGNVDTRLRKLRERGLDAIVLAACGLDRLGLQDEIGARLDPSVMLPEAAQGALALQVRAGEEERVAEADHAETRRRVEPERRCVATIGAGCLAPVAAHHDGSVLQALIAADDGELARAAQRRGSRGAGAGADRARREPRRGRRAVRVIVTRPRAQAGPLVARLEQLGAEVVECPLIEIERTSDEPVDGAGYDWLVVTSPNGADEIARRGRNLPQVAAVGPGTAEALRAHGIEPAFVPVESSQDGLLREFPRPPGRVLFAAAEGARRAPIDALGADFVPLYRTRLLTPVPPDGDVVVLASGSAARAYAALGGAAPAATIGPETSRVARSVGLTVAGEAASHDLDGLVAAVANLMDSQR